MKLKKGSKEAKAFMAKIRAKKGTTKKVGAVAKNKKGTPRKNLSKAQKDYNKDVEAYKYFVVYNGKIQSGYEYKNDALDYAKDFNGDAKVLYLTQLKQQGFNDPKANWKHTLVPTKKATPKKVGSTLKFSPKETRLGATDKDIKPKSKKYHKDTKSHNVNIKVVSGLNKIGSINLDTVGKELTKLETDIKELSYFIKAEKTVKEKNRLKEIKAVKTNQFKALKLYLNSIAKFR